MRQIFEVDNKTYTVVNLDDIGLTPQTSVALIFSIAAGILQMVNVKNVDCNLSKNILEKIENKFYAIFFKAHMRYKINLYDWPSLKGLDQFFNFNCRSLSLGRLGILTEAYDTLYATADVMFHKTGFTTDDYKYIIDVFLMALSLKESDKEIIIHNILVSFLPDILECKLRSQEKFGNLDLLMTYFDQEKQDYIIMNLDRLR